ncbi:hypothetical protein Salat_2600800, partial [Sesamum alatum]
MANDELPLDDIESGNGKAVVGRPSSEEENALNRLLSEFNLSEFLALANRVIDEGDIASMEAISDLKRRWNEKFGDVQPRPSMAPTRPSSTRTLTPFRPITAPTRPARRIPRMPTTEQMNANLLHTPTVVASFPAPLLSLLPSSMASSIFPVSAVAETLAPPSIVTVLEGSQQDPDNQPPSLSVDNQPQYCLHVETFQSDLPSIRVDKQPQSSIYIHSDPPSICVDQQPQHSLHVEISSFQSPPSKRVDKQPQPSLFIHSDPPSIRVDQQPQYSLHVETSSCHSPPSIRVDNQPQSSFFSMDTHLDGNLLNLPPVAPLTRPPSSAPSDKGNMAKPPDIFI